jgi:hypothetical protein
MKFSVGTAVGGPATIADQTLAQGWAATVLALDGVTSVFMTADFVTVTATPDVDWDVLAPEVVDILEAEFG